MDLLPKDLAEQVFEALAHPTRRAILVSLKDGRKLSGQIAQELGLPPANISQHLLKLKYAKIVGRHREDGKVFYAADLPLLNQTLRAFLASIDSSFRTYKNS